jgi:SAM-dependent methyltransferase
MDAAEFDKFAEEYRHLHAANIRLSGEDPEYFAEYKIADLVEILPREGFPRDPLILDFGAGIGQSVPYFRKYFPGSRVVCLDVSKKCLEIGRSRFGDAAEFVHFDGASLPFPDNSFDLAFLACVLHHIPHSEHIGIFKELRRVVRPDGALVTYEHNPNNPLAVHAVNTCAFDENAVLLKARELAASICAAGFNRPIVRYRIFFPHMMRWLRVAEPWMAWLPLGAQYCVHARKN